jgi:hypothetical protein
MPPDFEPDEPLEPDEPPLPNELELPDEPLPLRPLD